MAAWSSGCMPRWRAARSRSRMRSRPCGRVAHSSGLDQTMQRHNNRRQLDSGTELKKSNWKRIEETQRGHLMRQEFIAALFTAFVAPAAADDVAPGGTLRAAYIGP